MTVEEKKIEHPEIEPVKKEEEKPAVNVVEAMSGLGWGVKVVLGPENY